MLSSLSSPCHSTRLLKHRALISAVDPPTTRSILSPLAMTNYPPTPAFGGFPLPAPKGPPGLSQDLRKLSINSIGSNNTTLPSPAILSPNYLPKFPNSSSASRQQLSSPPSTVPITSPNPMHAPLSELNKQGHRSDDGLLDDREEGELSDAEDHEAPNINRRNNHSDSRQRDRNTQNQQGREFTLHGTFGC